MKKISIFAIILAMIYVFPLSLTASDQESTATINVVDPNGYNIIFNDNWPGMINGGNTIWTSPRIPHGETMMSSGFTMPNVVSPPGFVFGSWNTASNGNGVPFTATTPITAHIRVYAIWNMPNDTPDIGGGEPDNGSDAPGTGGGEPDNGSNTPGTGGGQPDNGSNTPGTGGSEPDDGNNAPGTGGGEPDNGNNAPGTGGGQPDNGNNAPSTGGGQPDTNRGGYNIDTPHVDGGRPLPSNEEPDISGNEFDFDYGRFYTSNDRLYPTTHPSPTPSIPNPPPLINEDNYLVQNKESWYEFDDMGKLLGTWTWDSNNNIWEFTPHVLQDSMSQARINDTICWLILAFAVASLVAFIVFYMRRRKKESGQYHNQK